MRLEQRIGRVDRIGQAHVVRAATFGCEDSVEYGVREVLEEKLAIILDEFGIDKTGDVLDSAQAGQMFDDLYAEAILHPEAIASSVENIVSRIQTQAQEVLASVSVLGAASELDPAEVQRLLTHPILDRNDDHGILAQCEEQGARDNSSAEGRTAYGVAVTMA